MRVLLLGKSGLLGTELTTLLQGRQGFELFAFGHEDFDINDWKQVAKIIQKTDPQFIINATGYTKVDEAEKEHEKAFQINAHAVGNLAKICAPLKIPIMHFSTDYVFGGHNQNGYLEDEPPNPINEYGKSKAHGEKLLMESTPYFFLIRTQWLYGHGGKNFVDTILKMTETTNPLRIVNDQFGKPTYVSDLVKAIIPFFQSNNYGIFHIVNEGVTSWYEFAKEILRIKGIQKEVVPITSEELNRPANRPKHSVLLNTKLPKLRPWKEALEEYLR